MRQIDIGRDLGLTLSRRKPKEWTQDYVPVTKIKDGVVVTKDAKGKNHYIKILEINAVNFSIMSPEEQDRLILSYIKMLRTGPRSFQIKIVTSQPEIEEYISAAKEALAEEENINCRTMIDNYIQYLSREARLQTYKKHYYYIFEYEPPMYGEPASSESEAIATVNRTAQEVEAGFKALGNKVAASKFKDEDRAIANILYNYYNRSICNEEPFSSRVKRITDDIKRINGLQEGDPLPDVDFKAMLAPKGIDFLESPSYMVIDGMYRSHFFIPGDSIPTFVYTDGGWLTEICNLGEGFDVDIFFTKENSIEKLSALRNNLKYSKYNLEHTEAEEQNAAEVAEKYQAAMFLQTALQSGGEEIYEMSILLTVYSYTLKDLVQRKAYLKKRGMQMNIEIRECKRFQEEAFNSTGFFLDLAPKMFNLTHRNITSSGVAACYPYTAFSLSDPGGIALGYHRQNRSLIIMDPFDPKYANSNIAVYGASGHGKTFALLTLTTRLRYQGVQNFILSPDKQHEFMRICNAIGGEFIDISPMSNQRINLFDIRPLEKPEAALLEGASFDISSSWLIDKISNIKIWCKYLIKDLTYAEEIAIENLLLEMYEDFGITRDNDSIFEDKEKKILKKMPIMSDFYKRVCESSSLRPDIRMILSQFVTGAAKSMNGQTNVNLDNKYIVFGLENIKGELLAPSMFIILEYVWGRCREDRSKKKMISIDEGWKLLDKKNPLVGEFVQEIFKVIRGYGGGALFATQSIADLFSDGSNFGNAILSCSHSKIILGMEQKDLNMLRGELGLTPTEASEIIGAEPGEALLCAGANHIPIKVDASAVEYKFFTTKSSDIAALIREAQTN